MEEETSSFLIILSINKWIEPNFPSKIELSFIIILNKIIRLDLDGSITNTPKSKKQKSMRFNRFMELYSTESNYVGILHAIVSEFQKPLDDMVDTPEELLNKSELRSIFNNFSPIYEVHLEMLNHFKELQSTWSDGCLIGKIILDHRDALLKAYPPYVNYFEQMKDTLRQCIAQNPKFHAFLKINESKSECGRQSLEDLMIRPVQRLPSISLLISDILKHTPKSNPDYKVLDESLNAIRDVMKYINEDKRKTEGRVALFDIFNDIDNCPADLVSSHRSYISRCEVSELSNCLSGRDDSLMIFLFTDYIEICKIRKSRGLNHIRSPPGTINTLNTTTRAHSHTHSKAYKHIRLIPLSSIPMVYDINDSERAFAMKIKDKFYCFNIQEECEKKVYLINFCKQLAENACRADYGQFLHECDSHELGIDISDINSGTLKRVYNFARTRLVSRAFSFKTTPLRVKRTVSTTSPLYLSTNSLMWSTLYSHWQMFDSWYIRNYLYPTQRLSMSINYLSVSLLSHRLSNYSLPAFHIYLFYFLKKTTTDIFSASDFIFGCLNKSFLVVLSSRLQTEYQPE